MTLRVILVTSRSTRPIATVVLQSDLKCGGEPEPPEPQA